MVPGKSLKARGSGGGCCSDSSRKSSESNIVPDFAETDTDKNSTIMVSSVVPPLVTLIVIVFDAECR